MAVTLSRRPLDKDYVQTTEGLFFCVYSYLHEPERLTAYLQYLPGGPDPRRDRVKPMDFPHVGAVADVMAWLKEHHPEYVAHCPIRGLELPLVPMARVSRYFRPEERLQAILREPKDELEALAAAFARTVAASAEIGLDDLGITGSVLLDVHDPATSDIDLVVYGREAALRVKAAFLQGHVPDVTSMTPARVERWLSLMSTHHPHTRAEAAYLVGRRWNYGFWRGREFGIKPVRAVAAVTDLFPTVPYQHGDLVCLRARITDASEGIYLPAVYRLTDAEPMDGDASGIDSVASFEWLYAGAFDAGQCVEIRGRREEIGPGQVRVAVGTALYRGHEYIRPLADQR